LVSSATSYAPNFKLVAAYETVSIALSVPYLIFSTAYEAFSEIVSVALTITSFVTVYPSTTF